jgi:uncharacterized protein YjiK
MCLSPMKKYVLLILAIAAISCDSKTQDISEISTDCPYDLQRPDRVLKLPEVLNEISGISFLGEDQLAAVQDEKGTVFFISGITGKIEKEFTFGGNGDYEDIALSKKGPIVLRSDGMLFSIDFSKQKANMVKQIKTPLDDKNDSEGLYLFRGDTRIWIACKEEPGLEKNNDELKAKRAIYSVDLMAPDSTFSVLNFIDEANIIKEAKKKFGDIEDEFKPSALAMHPMDGKVYILSAKNRLVAIFNPDFSLKDVGRFKEEHAEKAEGITFDNNGGMYISTEGRPAQLLYFRPNNKK